MLKDFYAELDEKKFKPITFTIYNKMDDESFVTCLENFYGEKLSIDDFKYYDFELTDKEKFLVKMHNSDFLDNIKLLKEKIKKCHGAKIYVDYEQGLIRIVKLNSIVF